MKKESSRAAVLMYRSLHLQPTFFGMRGLEPLGITMAAGVGVIWGVSIVWVLGGIIGVVAVLYGVRECATPYWFRTLYAQGLYMRHRHIRLIPDRDRCSYDSNEH